MIKEQFTLPLLMWFDKNGRSDLPWQHPRSGYFVWLSEIMLQQTQVKTVIPYFNRFIESFPTIEHLAKASEDDVFAHWAGLGYYSRARNLHKTAQIVFKDHQGIFPEEVAILKTLPGIGETTAAAIASQAYNKNEAILDGNVKRVLCRYFLVEGYPENKTIKAKLWQLAKQCMSAERACDYTQAIMDLGATCCTNRNPDCNHCPLNQNCLAKKEKAWHNLPTKKPKKIIPRREQQFLVIYNEDGQIYLEKRPPIGIWGGLFCLPALEMDINALDFIKENYSFLPDKVESLLNLQHSFSHFHLDLKAVAIKIKYENTLIRELPGKWVDFETIKSLGLAKPINDIVQYFFSKQ